MSNYPKRVKSMGGRPELVTITCADHHQFLTNGLWEFLQCNYGVDLAFNYGGRQINAHSLILDLFLSPDKLQDTVARRRPSQQLYNRSEIDCLLQFLYRGTVTIPKTQLEMLLELAKLSEFSRLVDALESNVEVGEPEVTLEVGEPEVNLEVGESEVDSEMSAPDDDSEVDDSDEDFEVSKRVLRKRKMACPKSRKSPTNCKKSSPCPKARKVPTKPKNSLTPVLPTSKADNISIPPQQRVVETENEKMNETENGSMYLLPEPENVSWNRPDESMADCRDSNDGIIGTHLTAGFDKDSRSASTDPSTPILADTEQESNRPEDSSQFQCQICSKSFACSSSLHRHNRKVHGAAKTTHKPDAGLDKTFQCDECGIVCSRAEHLRRHQLIHLKQRPFQCHLCGNGFSREPHLKRHLIVHSKDRPHPCHLCQMTFRHSHTLKLHLVSHHGEMAFKCELCGEAFDSHSLFKDHMDSHKVPRPYKCSFCDKTFKNSSGMTNHVRQKHTKASLDEVSV